MSATVQAAGAPRWVGPLELLCAVLLLALMALTALDVIGRYLLKLPVPDAADYVRGLMGLLIFGGLPLVSRRNAHLRAGFFDTLFSGRAAAVRETAVTVVSTAVTAVWSVQLARQALELQASGEILGMVPLRVGTLVWAMSALGAVSTVLLALHLPQAWAGTAPAPSPASAAPGAAPGAPAETTVRETMR